MIDNYAVAVGSVIDGWDTVQVTLYWYECVAHVRSVHCAHSSVVILDACG